MKPNFLSPFPLNQRSWKFLGLILGLFLIFGLTPQQTARAANFVVTKTGDTNDGVCDSDCSLREAIHAANTNPGADIINFDPSINGAPITLSITGRGENANATGDLDITDDLTIQGNGARSTIIDAADIDRVMDVHANITVNVNDVTIQNGDANQTGSDGSPGTTGEDGGGIRTSSGSISLTINDSRITSNHTYDDGGAVSANTSSTTIVINHSLIDNNSAQGSGTDNGGGLNVWPAGNITLNNSTISNNSSGNSGNGGAAFAQGGVITLNHSTVTGNSDVVGGNAGLAAASGGTYILMNTIVSGNGSTDCTTFGGFGTITSNGYNVVGSGGSANGCPSGGTGDQVLAGAVSTLLNTTLADNGGPTNTHALVAGSIAINPTPGTTGCGTTLTDDQRGVSRPQNTTCDVGAVEYVETVAPGTSGGDGPGGVGATDGSSTLKLWLRGDKGVFSDSGCTTPGSDGNTAGCWQDQSGNNFDFTNAVVTTHPVYEITETGINNQPSLQFTLDRLAYLNFPALTGVNDYAIYGVSLHSADGNSLIGGVQTGSNGHGLQIASWGGNDVRFLHRMPFGGSGGNDLITTNNAYTSSTPHMVTAVRNFSGSLQTVWVDSSTQQSIAATAAVFSSNLDIAVGNRSGGANSGHALNGYIGEVIIFTEAPTDIRRLLVENYLSSKFNIAIPGVNDVYDGDTLANGDFDLDVAGLGQTGGLQHTQAHSAGMIVVNNTFLNENGDWLLFGHKTTTNSNITTYLPTGSEWTNPNARHWARYWYMDVTDASNNNGTVNIIFDFSEAGMGSPSALPDLPVSNYRLLKRGNEIDSYDDITALSGATVVISGDQVQFLGVNVNVLGSNFTLGTLDKIDSPTALTLQSFTARPAALPLAGLLALVGVALIGIVIRRRSK